MIGSSVLPTVLYGNMLAALATSIYTIQAIYMSMDFLATRFSLLHSMCPSMYVLTPYLNRYP
jgi:hypothetical protein